MSDAERALFYIWVAGWLSVLWAWLSRKYGNWRELPNTRKLTASVRGKRKDKNKMTHCNKCFKYIESTTDRYALCADCLKAETSQPLPKTFGFARGWECPKCGAVLAPNQPYCNFCAPYLKVTCGFNPPWNFCGEQGVGAPFDEFGTTLNV